MNFSVNFASGHQDDESPGEEFDTVNVKRQWEDDSESDILVGSN